VRLVVQGQHMSKDKGDFTDAISPVPHLSGVRCCMSMATAMKWKAVGVDVTQGFIQAELLKDGRPSTYLPASRAYRGGRCGISGLEAPVRHAAFLAGDDVAITWQVSARHMVALAREQRFPEGRIRGCYVEQKGQGW